MNVFFTDVWTYNHCIMTAFESCLLCKTGFVIPY